ncbi:GATA zinc finger [Colletotrichum salicis]|uniref:GATA zinc finger n=1 Tax=Colletotrichum salicis TaxID=1209931 RepID=A0A135V3G8_9PEZI|nr:GATA zinc finger [Colletotrichum salicis]
MSNRIPMLSIKADAQLIHKRSKLGLQTPEEAEAMAANAFADAHGDAADKADDYAPPPMSFDQIKATEMIQRIHNDARQLLQNIQGLVDGTRSKGGCECGDGDLPQEMTSSSRILAAQSLSEVISDNLDDLALMSYRSATDAERQQTVSPKATRKRRHSNVAAFDRTSKVKRMVDESPSCHIVPGYKLAATRRDGGTDLTADGRSAMFVDFYMRIGCARPVQVYVAFDDIP